MDGGAVLCSALIWGAERRWRGLFHAGRPLAIKASAASVTAQVQAERRLSARLHPAAGAAATTTHGPLGDAHGQRQRTGSRT